MIHNYNSIASYNNCFYISNFRYARYDKDPSFTDFMKAPFGGWETPAIKQYDKDQSVCGVNVDLNIC